MHHCLRLQATLEANFVGKKGAVMATTLHRNKIIIIQVSGIVAVGKTYVMREILAKDHALERALGHKVVFVYEPVEFWKSMGWLDAFYANQKAKRLPFQLLALMTTTQNIMTHVEEDHGDTTVFICERGLHDQPLFWMANTTEEERSDPTFLEEDAYQAAWDLQHSLMPKTNGVIYVKNADAEEVWQRQKSRDGLRDDIEVSMKAYQYKLKALHEAQYTTPTCLPSSKAADVVPCIHIQSNDDHIVETVATYIKKLM